MDNTTNAAFIPTIIAQKALGYLRANLGLAKTVTKDFDWATFNQGQTLQIPKRGALSVNTKATNGSVVVQNPTATSTPVTLNKHFEVTFGIDNVTQVLENQNTLVGYGEDAANVLGEAIEGELVKLYSNLTATPIVFDATSAATIDSSMRAIRKYFTDAKIPVGEARNFMASSGIYNSLLSVAQYVQAQNLATNTPATPIVSGEVLPIFKVNAWESQLVAQTGASAPYTDHAMAYTKQALVLATRMLPGVPEGYGAVSQVIAEEDLGLGVRVVSSFNPNTLAMQVTLDALVGAAVSDARRAVEVQFAHS